MKTIIAGSRDIRNYSLVSKAIDSIGKSYGFHVSSVVCGGARGVDKLGEAWARHNKVKAFIYKANWDKHGKKAGFIRNTEMAKNSEALIALWDGKSKGTKHMIESAYRRYLTIFVVLVEKNTIKWMLTNMHQKKYE